MKRYLVFSWNYDFGDYGWKNFRGRADSIEACHEVLERKSQNDDAFQIVDSFDDRVVQDGQIQGDAETNQMEITVSNNY